MRPSETLPDAGKNIDQSKDAGKEHGYTIVLEQKTEKTVYVDAPLPVLDSQASSEDADMAASYAGTDPQASYTHTDIPIPAPRPGVTIPLANRGVPEQIRQMLSLYRFTGGTFKEKCRNFYNQGKFMEDYEDDLRWTGEYSRYFPTYNDLNIRQLRSYFSWRAHVRKGEFLPIPISVAYIYLYELLNGIGTVSPEDGLKKMKEFEKGFLDQGLGDSGMRKNLGRWMLEFGVIHDLDAQLIREYADPEITERDRALAVLKCPEQWEDEDIFGALCVVEGKKLEQSPLANMEDGAGKHLFAQVWRHLLGTYDCQGVDFFTSCFGKQTPLPWYPLANAIYWQPQAHPDVDYILDECRSYYCRHGAWKEARYDKLYFNREKFHAFIHGTDRMLRKYLKTGHYLRQNPQEAWVGVYVDHVIKDWEREKLKAMQPKITINLSDLDQIRQDAEFTRDSLLTEDEMDEAPGAEPAIVSDATSGVAEVLGMDEAPDLDGFSDLLDPVYMKLLIDLLKGRDVKVYIKEHHLMPSVAADTINEALFDEIGDNVLECDGENITIVEDYIEDIRRLLACER